MNTQIFATMGPACGTENIIKEMIDAGELGFRAETVDGKKKGFKEYSEEEIASINGGLNEYLIKMLYNK